MPLIIKNPQIQKAVDFEIRNRVKTGGIQHGAAVYARSTAEEIGMNMLWGYVSTLIEVSGFPELAKPLDLTYDTLPHLLDALSYLYLLGPSGGYSEEQNVEITEKVSAAYLTFLAANEHGHPILVRRVSDPEDRKDGSFWNGFEIRVGTTSFQADFLKMLHGAVTPGDNTLSIRFGDASDAYGMLTGKDLKDFGLGDVTIHFG